MSFKSSSYILDTSSVSNIWLANIYSHSVGCLFTFVMVFSSKSSIVFVLIFRSLIYFEFILCILSSFWSILSSFCVWSILSSFHYFACGCTLVPAPFVEGTILSSTELFWYLCWNQLTKSKERYISGLNFMPLTYICMPISHCLTILLKEVWKLGRGGPPILFFKIILATLGLLQIHEF